MIAKIVPKSKNLNDSKIFQKFNYTKQEIKAKIAEKLQTFKNIPKYFRKKIKFKKIRKARDNRKIAQYHKKNPISKVHNSKNVRFKKFKIQKLQNSKDSKSTNKAKSSKT